MRTRLIVVVVVLLGGAAGSWNTVQATPECPATMSGGADNTSDNTKLCPTVGGGAHNFALADWATVNGGGSNTANGERATVGGGINNQASGLYGTVGVGYFNKASGIYATVSGGDFNTASGTKSTVSGGDSNKTTGTFTTVGGGALNTAGGGSATVGGGGNNIASDDGSTVAGGGGNQAGDNAGTLADHPYATVGGGQNNRATGANATVAGGLSNTVSGGGASSGGGERNTVSGGYARVGGGLKNSATATYATVGGGGSNLSSGPFATVPGGANNNAAGAYSFAAGRQAKATQPGSFVWADSTATNLTATLPNQFLARASGGTKFFSNAAATSGVELPAGGGAWSTLSDRNAKANFASVDPQAVLAKLAAIPVQVWNYKSQDASVHHIGPMAQDFAAAFGVGEDNRHISTVDADGVALAAIQGLKQQADAKDRQIAALSRDVAALKHASPAFTDPMLYLWLGIGGTLGALVLLVLGGLVGYRLHAQRIRV